MCYVSHYERRDSSSCNPEVAKQVIFSGTSKCVSQSIMIDLDPENKTVEKLRQNFRNLYAERGSMKNNHLLLSLSLECILESLALRGKFD